MSWTRTTTSLITFLQLLQIFSDRSAPNHPQQNRLTGPREVALMLVSIGIFSLLLATLEHRQSIRVLGAQYARKRRSLAVAIAALISIRSPCATRHDLSSIAMSEKTT
jgi:uncharacterized membrane protein YidH (DUF202 family)